MLKKILPFLFFSANNKTKERGKKIAETNPPKLTLPNKLKDDIFVEEIGRIKILNICKIPKKTARPTEDINIFRIFETSSFSKT